MKLDECFGTRLGIALQNQLSFPVGKVDFLTLYPMSFSEFLLAVAPEILANYVIDFKKGDGFSEAAGE